jgi:hypothetical protein
LSAILKELKKRALKKEFKIEEHCFDKQIEFIRDPAKFKDAVCSRRAGKTEACAADLFNTALLHHNVNCLYITLSRTTAKRIIWKSLLKLKKEYVEDAKIDAVELSITFKNGSTIYCSGAKDESEIEKFRGMALKKVYIDECQSFRPYIQQLVDDIIIPALYDHDGSLILIGTPGPVKAGYFYDATHGAGFSHHKWTMLDNPWIKIKSGKEPAEILKQERERRGITETDPTYLRESLGRWAQDLNSLVFSFDPNKNLYNTLPKGRMEYIFGIDIGYNDADAIAVLGYSYEDKCCYLVEEFLARKQNITELVTAVNRLRDKYAPVRMVMDAGALGKKIQAEIQQRHAIPLEAADKNRKFEYIELLNDDLRTAKLKALPNSAFQEDSLLTAWDRSTPGKLKISDVYHSDICDAVLYAWRECKHYLAEAAVPKLDKNSEAYMVAFEEKLATDLLESQKPDEGYGSKEDMAWVFGDTDDDF